MRPLRYSINVALDGCCDHRSAIPNQDIHRLAEEHIASADAIILGRVTYQLMEDGWRRPVPPGTRPDWMEPFGRTINAAKKYVVSSTLGRVEWNSELITGDLETAIRKLKSEPGNGLALGGMTLPLALANMGLIDEYQFVVQPRLVGHGPTLFAGLSKPLDLQLVDHVDFASGISALRYVPR